MTRSIRWKIIGSESFLCQHGEGKLGWQERNGLMAMFGWSESLPESITIIPRALLENAPVQGGNTASPRLLNIVAKSRQKMSGIFSGLIEWLQGGGPGAVVEGGSLGPFNLNYVHKIGLKPHWFIDSLIHWLIQTFNILVCLAKIQLIKVSR